MFRTGENAAHDYARLFEGFLHVRADWWDGSIAFAIIHQQDGNAINVKLFGRVLGDLVRTADAFPRHFCFLALRWPKTRSASASPCLACDFQYGLRELRTPPCSLRS